jgi:hypothetical protein
MQGHRGLENRYRRKSNRGSNPTLSVGSNEVEVATFPWDENFHDNFFELGGTC